MKTDLVSGSTFSLSLKSSQSFETLGKAETEGFIEVGGVEARVRVKSMGLLGEHAKIGSLAFSSILASGELFWLVGRKVMKGSDLLQVQL